MASSEDEVEDQIEMILSDAALQGLESDQDEYASSSQSDAQSQSTSAKPALKTDMTPTKMSTLSVVHISDPSFRDSPTLQDSSHAFDSRYLPNSLHTTTAGLSSPHVSASPAPVSHSPPSHQIIVNHTVEPAQVDREPIRPPPSACAPTSSLPANKVALETGERGSTKPSETPLSKALNQQTPEPVPTINIPADPTNQEPHNAMGKRKSALQTSQSVHFDLDKGQRPEIKLEDGAGFPLKDSAAKSLIATGQSPKRRRPRKSKTALSTSVTEKTPIKASNVATGKPRDSPQTKGSKTSAKGSNASPAVQVIIPVQVEAPFKVTPRATELEDGKQKAEGNVSHKSRSIDPEIRRARTAKARATKAANIKKMRESRKRKKDAIIAKVVAPNGEETQFASSSAKVQQQKTSNLSLATDRSTSLVVVVLGEISTSKNHLMVTEGDKGNEQLQLTQEVQAQALDDGTPAAVNLEPESTGDMLSPTPSIDLADTLEVTLEANQEADLEEVQGKETVEGESSARGSPTQPSQPSPLPRPCPMVDIPLRPLQDISDLHLDDIPCPPLGGTQTQVLESPSISAESSIIQASPLTGKASDADEVSSVPALAPAPTSPSESRPSPIDGVPINMLTDAMSIDTAPIEVTMFDTTPIDAASFEASEISISSIDSTKSQVGNTIIRPTTNEALVKGVDIDPLDLATRSLYLFFRTGPDLLKKPSARAALTDDEGEASVFPPKRRTVRQNKMIRSDGEEQSGTDEKPVRRRRKPGRKRDPDNLYPHRRIQQLKTEDSVEKGDGENDQARNDPKNRLRRQSRVDYDLSRRFDDLLREVEKDSEREGRIDEGEAEIFQRQQRKANPFISDEAVQLNDEGNSWQDSIQEGLSPPRKRIRRQTPVKVPGSFSAMSRIEAKVARERETLAVCCRMNGDPPRQRYREPSLESFLIDDDEPEVQYAKEIPLIFPQARQNRIVLARQTASPPPTANSQPHASIHLQLSRLSPSPSQPIRRTMASQLSRLSPSPSQPTRRTMASQLPRLSPSPSHPTRRTMASQLPRLSPSPSQPTRRTMTSQPIPASSSRPSPPSTSHRQILSDLQAIQTALSQLSTSYSQVVQNLASLGSTSTSTLRSHGEWMNQYGQFLAQHAMWENFATLQLVKKPSYSPFTSRCSTTSSSSSSSSPLLKQRILENLQEMKRAIDQISTLFHLVVRNLANLGQTSQLNGEWMSGFGQFLSFHGKWERKVASELDGGDDDDE
ncbi:uncharacterized protein UTRI_05551 [Ustilago trichophora]|uniref:Uncharacterized protein n=1 Tax=Ustilago trichophora TaxID=86804 RepID=A0A5C3EKE4_9BASI|nr:uncharacterized protein UTRI_05551 [Ustilago trichophora]